jgi:hypothetical protein
MVYGTSRDELIRFLKLDVEQGRSPINTGLSRLASVRKVLSVLSDEEAQDVTKIDVESVMRRFIARSAHQYSLASHVSYKSRLRSSLQEFSVARAGVPVGSSADTLQKRPSADEVGDKLRSTQCIQIPLSAGATVVIDRLPIDLTEAEAQRICNVLLAMAA